DITALMNYRLKTQFHENPHYIRGIALSASLGTLKEALCRQFERDQLTKDETEENEARYGSFDGEYYIPGSERRADTTHYLNDMALKPLVQKYWVDYEKYIDREKEKAFMDRFTTDLTRYDNTIISPMTEMYLDWLKSQTLLDYFDHNFDSTDDYSGALFTQSVHDCVYGMQDKLGASHYFQEQMMRDSITPDNLLLRALVMNSDKRIEQTHGVLKTGADYGSLAWDKIPDGLKDMAEHFHGPASLTIEKYLNELSSTLFAVMNKAVEKVPLPALVVLAKLHGRELKVIKFVGKRKHFLSAVVTQLSLMADLKQPASSDKLRHHVDIEMRRLEINGLPMEGDQEFNFVTLADAGEAEKTRVLPEAERAKSVVKTLHSVDEIRAALFPRTLRTKLAQLEGSSVENIAKQLAHVPPFIGCTFSLVLQISALRAAGWPKENTEVCTRFAADLVAAMGALAEICERLLKNFQVLRLQPMLSSVFGEKNLLKLIEGLEVMKFFGSWAGIVGVAWDLYHVWDELGKGNVDLGIAYLVSAIGGGLLFAAAINLITLGPLGIILALMLFFGANIYLEMKKKNEIQKWLAACLWRKIPAGEEDIPAIWPDSRMEMDSFHKLMTSVEA
ncbi:T6SS effector BTH_I2691 family protein, partial [Photorhabdus heterorhabditis]|uniref:T6SS effector BTH_I2691 family protein n=1 Tax=Photorhabdus heterorhabditis TaxID=880156 RepID=UPI001BD61032